MMYLLHLHRIKQGIASVGIVFAAIVLLSSPYSTHALEISIEPEERVFVPGDVFVVPVRVSEVFECVNAFSVEVSYDTERLTAVDVGRGSSILTLWTEDPTVDQKAGVVQFSGGVPGGYCGRLQGDPGLTNILAELVFSVNPHTEPENIQTALSLTQATVHAHDGQGTILPLTSRSATLEVSSTLGIPPVNEWVTSVREDATAPELFDVILHSDPSVAGGRYYILFSTTDKQSGLSHYEVLETDPMRWGFLSWISRETGWVPATSPFVLRDQKLRSTIQVKAVDKAGNERIVTYQPPEDLRSRFNWTDGVALLIVIVVIAGLAYLTRRTWRRRTLK